MGQLTSRAGAPRRKLLEKSNLLTSLLLVFPLFLVYQIGVLAVPEVYNGADLLTAQLLRLLHGSMPIYIGINLGLLVIFVIAVQVLRRKNNFDPVLFVPTLIESAAYAVTMGAFIVFVMTRILHIDPRLTIESGIPLAAGSQAVGPLGKVILAFGAGVHEELVFRLFMVSALLWVGVRGLKMRRFTAALVAFVISSFLFSAAHHVIGGEPWRLGVFTYRFLCGMIFASLFQFRGFAVAVYTHALYDIFVLLLG